MRSSREPAFTAQRFQIAALVAMCAFLVLIARIYTLQIIRGDVYKAKSESNFVQERRVAHTRGLIYDQQGNVLVDNRPSHDLYMTLAFLPDSERTLRYLSVPLGLDREARLALDQDILRAVDKSDDRVPVREGLAGELCDEVEEIATRRGIGGIDAIATLTDGEETCDVVIHADDFPSRRAVFRRLKLLLDLPEQEIDAAFEKAMRKARGLGRFKPTLLLGDIPFEAYARIESAASLGALPGIDVLDSKKRRYLKGSLGSHMLGFTNELSAEELRSEKGQGYRMGDRIGRRGIEEAFEDHLRGEDGVQKVVVDAKGRRKDTAWAKDLLGDEALTPPTPGHGLVLAIDERMQRTAEQAFLGRAGSVVAIEADTGFVLAMASVPDFDPNEVTGRQSAKVWRMLSRDPLRPLKNKAIQDHYAPGSTFKAVTGLAGLREGIITPSSTRMCPGYFRLGRHSWRCYNRGGHGSIALLKALQKSCDTYFYSVGHELGSDRLAGTARLLGFGSPTGLGLDNEIPGIMPDRAYYQDRLGYYTPGLVVNSSIGQGDVAVTPIQLALAYATIVNGGTLYRPQVVREIRDARGGVVQRFEPEVVSQLNIDPADLNVVRESLSHVTEPGGTAAGLKWRRSLPDMARWVRESGVVIGGKTGTAQVVKLSKNIAHIDPDEVDYMQRDHAWFVGFAPAHDPEVVVVTMTEHGGFGGTMSAPVTAQVLQTWFEQVRGAGRYRALAAKSVLPDGAAPPKPVAEKPPVVDDEPNEEDSPREPAEPEGGEDGAE